MSKITYTQVVRQVNSALNKAIGRVLRTSATGAVGYSETVGTPNFTHHLPAGATIRIADGVELHDTLMTMYPRFDASVASDYISLSFNKATSDAGIFSDKLAINMTKVVAETITQAEVLSKLLTKGASDSLSSVDTLLKTLSRQISESITAVDLFVLLRGMETSDSQVSSDTLAKTAHKGLLDSSLNTEAIHLVHENYVAPGYVALGYVGDEYDL